MDSQTVGADPANPIVTPVEPVGTRGVCLIVKTLPLVGMQIDLSIEGDTPKNKALFNPKDPAHVLGWYVHQHAADLIAHAAVALAETAKREAVARADVQGDSERGFARAAANHDLDDAIAEDEGNRVVDSEGGEPA